MLALTEAFEKVKDVALAVTLSAGLAVGANADPSGDALYNPDTTFEKEQYYDNMLENPDMNVYDNDDIAWKLTDTGNEQAYYELKERADTSGGELGLNHRIERGVDQKMQRFDGSLSQNLSEGAQEIKNDYEAGLADKFGNWDEGDELALVAPEENENLELDVPDIQTLINEDGPEVAVQALVVQLMENGVHPAEVDEAMRAGNDFDVLNALADVAKDNGLEDLTNYGNDVQVAFAGIGVPEAIQNIAPEITEAQPQLAVTDPRFDMEEQQPKMNMMGMG